MRGFFFETKLETEYKILPLQSNFFDYLIFINNEYKR